MNVYTSFCFLSLSFPSYFLCCHSINLYYSNSVHFLSDDRISHSLGCPWKNSKNFPLMCMTWNACFALNAQRAQPKREKQPSAMMKRLKTIPGINLLGKYTVQLHIWAYIYIYRYIFAYKSLFDWFIHWKKDRQTDR